MSTTTLDILTMYNNGLSVEEIAADTGYDALAVKQVLIANSPEFRKSLKATAQPAPGSQTENDAQEESKIMLGVIRDIALTEEDNPMARLRAAIYVHDELKGRNDKKEMKGPSINVLVLNAAINRARLRSAETDISSMIELPEAAKISA